MGIRFILGRAGSGKTYRCLEQIRQRLRQSAVAGNRLLFLVPEQASFQMERALIETPDIAGYTRCEVMSFQRLAFRIFADAGAGPGRGDQTIGSLGRLMLIRRVLRQEGAGLVLLGRVADRPGMIKQVAGAIDELMREQVEPSKLAEAAEQLRERDPLQAAKLGDLSRLYRAYIEALGEDRLDPGQYLALAAERAAGCPWLDGAEIWVDGFAGFSGQEYQLLTTLARRAANFEITMLVEPDTPAVSIETIDAWWMSLFSRTERTMVRLREELKKAGLGFDAPVRLTGDAGSRFARPELGRLEASLFARASGKGRDGEKERRREGETGHDCGLRIADCGLGEAAAVEVWEVPDRRVEVELAVAEILRLRREASPPMRYRDVAVIVRELGPYHDLISAAMKAHDIPCFIDRRQPTTQHPLVECVRGLLAIAGDDCRLESVRLLLKTGLLPITDEEGDLLENYVLACGIAGRAMWKQPWAYTRYFQRRGEHNELSEEQGQVLARVNAAREKFWAAVGGWVETATGGGDPPFTPPTPPLSRGGEQGGRPEAASGRDWAAALFGCLEHIGAGSRLHEWAVAAEDGGRPDEAEANRQVWADFVDLLDEFVRALGGEAMRIREFQETIEAGLADFTLGLAPATLDQVLVGAIERSRHPPVRAVLLLGFDDANFPKRRGEDPLLGDDERETLAAAQAEIGPPRRQQLLDERMLAYIALTRASERVVISYPRAEADGKPVNASAYLRDILAALPGLAVRTVPDPRGGRELAAITCASELGARMAREFRYRPELTKEAERAARARWNGVYEAVRAAGEAHDGVQRALAGLRYANVASLEKGFIERLVGKRFAASVSRLELFAACRFAHYVEYFLRLEPRIEADMRDVDIGTLAHAILEKFIGDLADGQRRLGDLEDDEIGEGVGKAAETVVPQMTNDLMLSEARNLYLLARGQEQLQRVLRWQRDSARVGEFRPFRVEFAFGYAEVGAGQLKLKTPKGRDVWLRGRIDRVDVAELADEVLGVVIDYKHTTQRVLDAAKVYHGLSLQLVGYLLALAQAGEAPTGRRIRPVAALYLPLLEPYKSVAHPSEEKRVSYQWRGISDASGLAAMDRNVQPGGASQFYAARLKKDGEPYGNCDLAGREDFAALMAHVAARMSALADDLIDGDVAVSPYRLRRHTPCAWCQYRAVCRYEFEMQAPRGLEALRKADVFERIAASSRTDEGGRGRGGEGETEGRK